MIRKDCKPHDDDNPDSVRHAGYILALVGAILLASIVIISTIQLRESSNQRSTISEIR